MRNIKLQVSGLLYILLISSSLFAQDTIRKRKFYIGVFGSPDYSYRIVPSYNPDVYNYNVTVNRNDNEIPKFGYTVGAEALYQFNKRIAISFGIQFSVKGESVKDITLNFGYTQIGNTQPLKNRFKQSVRYIDLPIRIDFYLSKKKTAPFITTGVSPNIYINEKVTSISTYSDGHTSTGTSTGRSSFHAVNPQFQIGFGLDATFKKTRLRVFPVYRMSFVKVTSGPIKEYYYSIGLGINYFFGL